MPGDLYTPRLHLRPLAQGDERLYCGLYTDAEAMRHVSAPLTPEAAERAFRAVLRQLAAEPPQSRYWILAPREGGADLGLMAWVPDRDDAGSAEVGLLLVGPAQCRGYAAEAIAVLADEVFAATPLQRLWTRHAERQRRGHRPDAQAGLPAHAKIRTGRRPCAGNWNGRHGRHGTPLDFASPAASC